MTRVVYQREWPDAGLSVYSVVVEWQLFIPRALEDARASSGMRVAAEVSYRRTPKGVWRYRMRQRRSVYLGVASLMLLTLSACSQPLSGRERGALLGGGAGAAGGALIGGLTGAPGTGALVGGAAGAVGGSLAGEERERRRRNE